MKKKIGFIGLGIMGKPMAKNLLKAGYELIVFNRTREKAEELAAGGARVASSPAQVASNSEVIITVVSNHQALEDVILGKEGVLSTIKQGTILIDSSTVAPSTTRRFAQLIAAKGAIMLDAPLTGSKLAAEAGTIVFNVGGDRAAYEACQDIFAAMGRKSIYIGESGQGAQAKLCNQLIVACMLEAISEGLVMAVRGGIDPDVMIEVLSSSAARSGILEMKAQSILKRDFDPHFSLKLMHKDLSLVLESATELNVPVLEAAVVREIFGAALAQGKGEMDFSAIITISEELAGVEVKRVMRDA